MLADTCVIVTVCRDNQQPVHTGKRRIQSLRLIEIAVADVNAAGLQAIRLLRVSYTGDKIASWHRFQ
ncbi:hypothetical protein D3C71_2231550 [compost metagenome]